MDAATATKATAPKTTAPPPSNSNGTNTDKRR